MFTAVFFSFFPRNILPTGGGPFFWGGMIAPKEFGRVMDFFAVESLFFEKRVSFFNSLAQNHGGKGNFLWRTKFFTAN